MRPGEYGFDFNSSTCPYCGASVNNHYEHDEHCLLNIIDHRPAFVEAWKKGYDDCFVLKGRVLDGLVSDMMPNTVQCFIKGFGMAKKRMAVDPAFAAHYRDLVIAQRQNSPSVM